MVIGYRTIFDVHKPTHDVLERTVAEFRYWLSHKPHRQYDGDALEFDAPLRLGEDARALLVREECADGSASIRATLSESNDAGAWTTRLTTHAPRHGHPQIWIDVDGPALNRGSGRRQWVSTPNLAKNLLKIYEGFDGLASLGSRPQRVFPDDVDQLIDVICDPDRRGLVYVAGAVEDRPLEQWIDVVADLLRDTVGLAGAYVMDPAATVHLADQLGSSHAVPVGTIRTFRRGADPASLLDARRHRILGARRLATDNLEALQRTLGARARDITIAEPLPRALLRLNTRLEERTNAVMLDRAETDTRTLATAAPVADIAVETEAPTPLTGATKQTPTQPATQPAAAVEAAEAIVAEATAITLFAAEVRNATGIEPDPHGLVDAVLRWMDAGIVAETREQDQEGIKARLTEVTDRLSGAEAALEELTTRLEDEQLAHAETQDDLHEADGERDVLRVRLFELDRHDLVWTPPLSAVGPESFSDVLDQLGELSHVVFTGDEAITRALEENDTLGVWARKSWDVLNAVNDYARAKAHGVFTGSVDSYLKDTPPGYAGYPQRRHGRDESEPVKNRPKYRAPRTLPVPTTVDSSGRIFMGAHFKIIQSGLTSPRLHYHDATAVDGTIYVGYLGPHLPTPHTN